MEALGEGSPVSFFVGWCREHGMLGHCSTVIVRDSENSRSISQDSSLCSTYFFARRMIYRLRYAGKSLPGDKIWDSHLHAFHEVFICGFRQLVCQNILSSMFVGLSNP